MDTKVYKKVDKQLKLDIKFDTFSKIHIKLKIKNDWNIQLCVTVAVKLKLFDYY